MSEEQIGSLGISLLSQSLVIRFFVDIPAPRAEVHKPPADDAELEEPTSPLNELEAAALLDPLTKIMGCILGSYSHHRSNRLNPPTFCWTILSFIRRVLRVTARGRDYTKGKCDVTTETKEKRVKKDIPAWILVVFSIQRQRVARCRAQRRRLSSCKRANGWEGLYLSYA